MTENNPDFDVQVPYECFDITTLRDHIITTLIVSCSIKHDCPAVCFLALKVDRLLFSLLSVVLSFSFAYFLNFCWLEREHFGILSFCLYA